jgi:putative hydrolase of the HAD superfamily
LIKAVTFDFGETLATGKLDAEVYRKRLLDYIHSLGYAVGEVSLKKTIDGMLVKLRKKWEKNLELTFEELYASVLYKLGIATSEEILSHIYELYLQSFPSQVIHGTEEVLATLQGRYKLAVISNAISNFPRHTLSRYGLDRFFQVVVVSRDIGIRKPDPRIFEYALEKLRVKPRQAIHVGNSMKSDVIGAKRTGMKAVWIKRGEEQILEEPDYVINSITDLPRILKNPNREFPNSKEIRG